MKFSKALLASQLLLLAGISSSMGSVTITAFENGGDVVFSGSGTLNLSSLHHITSGGHLSGINPNELGVPVLVIGALTGTVEEYGWGGVSTPPSFGTGGSILASSGSGDSFGTTVDGQNGEAAVIWVPAGYVSGSWLSGSMTFTGQTFASLELISGIYTWSWGLGESADSMTLVIPEPSAVLMMLASGLLVIRRKR
jgi:hypothetical protein